MAHAVPPGSNVPATVNSIEKDAPPALLGPEDQVTIHVMEEEQIPDKPFRIDNEDICTCRWWG